jgi:hypothetical protein
MGFFWELVAVSEVRSIRLEELVFRKTIVSLQDVKKFSELGVVIIAGNHLGEFLCVDEARNACVGRNSPFFTPASSSVTHVDRINGFVAFYCEVYPKN